jgi:hypothetical protein
MAWTAMTDMRNLSKVLCMIKCKLKDEIKKTAGMVDREWRVVGNMGW